MGALLVAGSGHVSRAPIDIGDRLEIFVDRHLIDSTDGATLTMGQPRPEEIVMTFDRPWEGGSSAAYPTVIKDGKTYRMYYRGGARAPEGLIKSGTETRAMPKAATGSIG